MITEQIKNSRRKPSLKVLNALLILTSLLGYLEWGGSNSAFLFQAEAEILSKILIEPSSVLHPLTILPLAGQIVLLITLFQKEPGRYYTVAGLAGIGILLLTMFIIGLFGLNFKVAFSTVPFLVVALLTVKNLNRNRGRGRHNAGYEHIH